MLGPASNYVWQVGGQINEFTPPPPPSPTQSTQLFSPLHKQQTDGYWPIVTAAQQLIFLSLTNSQSFLQIRAEKPYYMADPEVDSLVSLSSSSFFSSPFSSWLSPSSPPSPDSFKMKTFSSYLSIAPCWQEKGENVCAPFCNALSL